MSTYNVYTFDNVVENKDGSWGAKALTQTDVTVNIDTDTQVKDLCKQLKAENIIPSYDMRKLTVTDLNSDIVEIKQKKDGFPLCRLVKKRF